ncbi:MAG: hypothetical protein IT167_14260 [Bryobacterales bacterium]|nr:hypothetical protein [Bryobacterales bacterium]
MKLVFIVVAALLTIATSTAKGGPAGRTLKVYVIPAPDVPMTIVGPAKETVRKIYSRVGILVQYSPVFPKGGQAHREMAMVVRISTDCDEPPQGGIAVAQPYEGSWIQVRYNRVKWAAKNPVFTSTLLGYVMAHEIAHNLQGIARHSDTGIMKARWSAEEYTRITVHELRFDPHDVHLIDLGWQSRHARP